MASCFACHQSFNLERDLKPLEEKIQKLEEVLLATRHHLAFATGYINGLEFRLDEEERIHAKDTCEVFREFLSETRGER